MTEKSVVDIPIGSVVLANAGRDKGRYFVAVSCAAAVLCISQTARSVSLKSQSVKT